MEPLRDSVNEYMAQIRLARALDQAGIPVGLTGIEFALQLPSGFADFDRLLGGLTRTNLIAIGGGAKQGKTALAVNIARHVAVRFNLSAAIFSVNMSRLQLAQRFLAVESGVDPNRMLGGRISQSELKNLREAVDALSRAPIYVDDTPDNTIDELKRKLAFVHSDHLIDLVMVDHLNEAPKENLERDSEIGPLSCSDQDIRVVKSLCRELNAPMILFFNVATSARNSGVEGYRPGSVPDPLLQHCDCIALIERADEDSERKGILDLHVVKNRDGPTGSVSLVISERTGKIVDLGAHP
jgi:replicative DNA helicase